MTWQPPLPPGHSARTCVGALALAMAMLALACVPRVVRVQGQAMEPTLKDGDRAVFNQAFKTLVRGDVIALRYPRNQAKSFVMRIVGMPGETLTIVDGVVHVDGRPLAEPYVAAQNRSHESLGARRIGPDAFFVMGDNRRNASDSREWGTVPRDHVWARWEK